MFAKADGTIICMGWVVSGDLKVVGVSQRVGNRVFKITSKKEPFFPPPLGLFGPFDHILQKICLKLGMASFLVHIHIF